jgi:hypothetical protein
VLPRSQSRPLPHYYARVTKPLKARRTNSNRPNDNASLGQQGCRERFQRANQIQSISWSSVALVALTYRQPYRCHAARISHCSEVHRHESSPCSGRSKRRQTSTKQRCRCCGRSKPAKSAASETSAGEGWRGRRSEPANAGGSLATFWREKGCCRARKHGLQSLALPKKLAKATAARSRPLRRPSP